MAANHWCGIFGNLPHFPQWSPPSSGSSPRVGAAHGHIRQSPVVVPVSAKGMRDTLSRCAKWTGSLVFFLDQIKMGRIWGAWSKLGLVFLGQVLLALDNWLNTGVCYDRSGVGAPVIGEIDGEYRHDSRRNTLEWCLPVIDAKNKSGSLEFSIAGQPSDFFPVQVSFISKKNYCNIQVPPFNREPVAGGRWDRCQVGSVAYRAEQKARKAPSPSGSIADSRDLGLPPHLLYLSVPL